MRVLAVTPWFPSSASPGSGIFNLRDAELLALDHDVQVLHLIAPRFCEKDGPGSEVLGSGITVHRIPFELKHPSLLVRARSRIREMLRNADLLHTMAFPALFPTKLARPQVPWVHTEHWSGLVRPAPSLHARAGAYILRHDLNKPDELVAVSRYFADTIDRHRTHETTVIANYVRVIDPESLERRDKRGRVRMIGVAGLVPWKGPMEALDALGYLVERGVDASLDWAGVGPLEVPLMKAASDRGLADRFHLHGHVSPDALSELLRQSDVFVLPTEVETFGVAIAEALGHGLPVVTSGFGGHLEFLPSEASRLVAVRTGRALADAVSDLISDESKWSSAQIIEYAQSRFGNASRRDLYREVYDRALSRKR